MSKKIVKVIMACIVDEDELKPYAKGAQIDDMPEGIAIDVMELADLVPMVLTLQCHDIRNDHGVRPIEIVEESIDTEVVSETV